MTPSAKKTYLRFLAPAAWMSVIFWFSHQQAESSNSQSGAIFNIINPLVTDVDEDLLIFIIRKTAHFMSYLLLGALLFWAIKPHAKSLKTTAALSVAVAFLFAVSDEIHQMLIPGRSAEVRDVLLDTLGAATGVALVWLILHLYRKNVIIRTDSAKAANKSC